ncbi:hypothetical protein SAMN05421761_10294 [Belliella pelovolcani]|uniref:Uncharacterized protein n=1 Tax=Belliella pelovolcani TaxID=529505 RepID=A0A1N7KHV3_9BACT|nr:hypothetical protein SAMN05421761_10294 [Belliella pelovolcani]
MARGFRGFRRFIYIYFEPFRLKALYNFINLDKIEFLDLTFYGYQREKL